MSDSETKQEPKLHVALCREADDLRSLHKLIGTKLGDEPWKYWDAAGVPLTSAVENLLGVCGYGGAAPPVPEVRAISEEDINAVPLLGFTVEASEYGTIRSAIIQVATGQIGGFTPIVVAQSGFHDAAIDVMAYVWSLSGRPTFWIRRPPMGSRGGGLVPQNLPPLAEDDLSYSSSRLIRSVMRAAAR
jgi:hypothetical protein